MSPSKEANTEDLNTDIVVVGGGGTGLAAAVAAAEKGASVIVLEKRHALGGTSAMAGALFAAESSAQKRMMIDAPRDYFFKRAMDFTHWKVNPRIVRAFIDKSADTVRWLEEKGLKIVWIRSLYPNQIPQTMHQPEGGGAGLIKLLAKNCEELGVKVLLETPAKRILTSKEGGVTGVLAETEGKEIKITTKSIIIGSGGFGGNKELLNKYCPTYDENMSCSGIPHMGDGLLMATEIGAATEGLGLLLLSFRGAKSKLLRTISREPTMVYVNKRGERFFDESLPENHERGNPPDRQPGKTSYAFFDAKIKQYIIEDGLKRYGVGLPRREWFLLPQIEPTELENEIKIQAGKGEARVSDSWEEIAKWIGVASGALKATIDEYNSFCDRGHDELFVKDPRYLLPLRTPPYYAVKSYLSFHNTIGGIKINHHMEVLDHRDNPIPGLYAGGVDTGGWLGDTYGAPVLPGMAFGFAVNSGRIAGENAARYVSS